MMKSEAARPARRLHPASALFFIAKALKELLYPLIAFILTTVWGGKTDSLWIALGAILFILLTVAIGVVSWMRYRYDVRDRVLVVQSGVLVRKNISIPRERIQSLDQTAGIFQRMFGVVKLQVETAGGKKPEAVLHAVGLDEAERIRKQIFEAAEDQPEPEEQLTADNVDPFDSIRLSPRRLMLYSATSGRAFLTFAFVGAAYSQFDDFLEKYFDVYEFISSLGGEENLGWIITIVLALAWMIGIVLTAMKYYGYTLRKTGEKLHIDHGFLERKQVTISPKRIQAVQVKQNLLQRLAGCFSIHVVSAGYGGKVGESALLFPLLRAKEIPAFLAQFATGYRLAEKVHALPKQALRQYLTVPLILALVAAIPCIIWIPDGYGRFAILLPAVAIAWSWLRFKGAGWALDGDRIVIRSGGFGITTSLMPRRRIQWYGTKVSPLQMRKGLSTLRVALSSGSYHMVVSLRHAGIDVCRDMMKWMGEVNERRSDFI